MCTRVDARSRPAALTGLIPQRLEETVGVPRAPLIVAVDVDVEPSLDERFVAVHAEQRREAHGGGERSEGQGEQTEERDSQTDRASRHCAVPMMSATLTH